MKNLLDYLNNNEICVIYDKLNSYERDGMWSKRAINLLDLILRIEPYLENPTRLNRILDAVSLNALIKFYNDKNLDNETHEILYEYLRYLPGFDFSKEKQSEDPYQQNGFLAMQLVRYLGDINISYQEYPIFEPEWINKEEKIELINQKFSEAFPNAETDIIKIFKYFLSKGTITSFTFWNVLVKEENCTDLLKFTFDTLEFTTLNFMSRYKTFIESLRKNLIAIDLKDSLVIELNNKGLAQKSQVLKI